MTRQKPIEVITPPNMLKTKVGGAIPALDQRAIAKAEAALTEIEYGNTKILADKNVVSPNELALANAKFNKAKAEVALASTHKSP